MALRTQILSLGVLWVFVFVILSASLACADSRPFGVYQPGRAHARHRAGLGRTAAHTFKAGFFAAKDDDASSRLRRHPHQYAGFKQNPACVNSLASAPETSLPLPLTFIRDLSPVLNL
jgi:hypothetical protein